MRLLGSQVMLLITVGLLGCATPGAPASPSARPDPTADASRRNAVKVTQTAQGVVLTSDERILFDTGKSVVRDEGQVYIDRVAKILKERSNANVSVEGHTDNVGSADLNMKLSEARAQAVRAALLKAGVDARRVAAKGHGFSRPVGDNATPEGRQMNRRTDILLLGEKIENIGGEGEADRLSEGFANFLKDPVGTLKNLLSR